MPINFSFDLSARRKEQQALDELEKRRAQQMGNISELLYQPVPTARIGQPLQFGPAPTIDPQQAEAMMALTPEKSGEASLKLLEQQRSQQQAEAQRQQLAGALQSPAFQATPETRAVAELLRAGGSPEQAALFKDQFAPFTLGADQQRFTGTGETIAIGPEKLADLQARRDKMFTQATQLRGEFIGITKPFEEQNQAYGRVLASAADPTPAGDLALIFNFMKVLDPGSTVREGEFAQVGAAGGLPTQAQRLFDSWVTGKKLTPSQRADVLGRATKLFEQAAGQHKKTAEEFRNLAKRQGLDPKDVIFQRQTVEPFPTERPPLSSFEAQ